MFKLLIPILFVVIVLSTTETLSTSLKEVCSGKGSIGSVNEAINLINEFKAGNQQKCPDEYKNSILELEKVISDENRNDICSEKAYEAIEWYHQNFISIYTPDCNKDELKHKKTNPIPKGVRDYFITYASDAALLCSKKLIERFDKELKGQLFQLREINEFKNARKMLLEYLDSYYSDKNIEQPKHISDLKFRSHDKRNPLIHLVIGERKKSDLNRVIEACEVRYNKVSNELFKSVSKFNSLGYGIKRLSMQETMSLLSHEYAPWILAIDTCDLLEDVDIIIDSNKQEAQPTLINQDNVLKLKESQQAINHRGRLNFDSPLPLQINHETIKFVQFTEQKNVRDVVAKFDDENKRLIKVKTGKEVSLNNVFNVYEQEAVFTTESPSNSIDKLFHSWIYGH